MDEINISEYLKIIMLRKGVVVGTTIAAAVIAAIVLLFVPKTYEGRTTLMFPDNSASAITPQISELMSFVVPGVAAPTFGSREVYITVLKSRTISENVCKRVGLGRYGVGYDDLQKKLKLETTKEGSLDITCRVPTCWLKGHVPKRRLGEQTAQLSADVTNAYVSELERYNQSNSLFMGKKHRIYIESQVSRAKSDLAEAEVRLRSFQQAHPALIPPDKSTEYADQMLKLVDKRVEADVGLQEAEGQLRRARATWAIGAPNGISPQALVDSPALSELRTTLTKLDVRRATLLENFKEDHPDVVSLNQEIDKTHAAINAEVERMIGGKAASMSPAHQELLKQLVILEVMRDGMEARRSALAKATAGIESELSNLPSAEIEYGRLLRDLKATETIYMTLLAELAKARVAESRDTDNFIVLDRAIVPDKPTKPKAALSIAMALSLGALFGILIVTVQGMPFLERMK